jgi:hypothetical protein
MPPVLNFSARFPQSMDAGINCLKTRDFSTRLDTKKGGSGAALLLF